MNLLEFLNSSEYSSKYSYNRQRSSLKSSLSVLSEQIDSIGHSSLFTPKHFYYYSNNL